MHPIDEAAQQRDQCRLAARAGPLEDVLEVVTHGTLLASGSARWGWMVGIGYEYAFLGNWSAKIEYDYLGFGSRSITLTSVPGVTPPTRQLSLRPAGGRREV